MKPKKSAKPVKKDEAWQEKIEKRIESEGVKLDHPAGKERFERIIRRLGKKNER